MSEFKISAEPRTVIGKQVKQLRREGLIPAVMYGKSDPVNLQLSNFELRAIFRHGAKDGEIELTIGDATHTVVVKELQRHMTRGDLLHVDFMETA